MGVTSINSTRNGSGAVSYVLTPKEKGRERVRAISGNNVNVERASEQMRITREAHGKNGINNRTGKEFVQAYRLKQSFSDKELDPNSEEDVETCNRMGSELAKEIYPDREVLVVTHSDGLGGKLHNHLIINAVSFETGKSLRGKETNWNYVSEKSDEILKANGLSVIENKKGQDKRTQAEIELAERGEYVWKDDLKERIRTTLSNEEIIDKDSFIDYMKEEHEVSVRFRGKGMSYSFEDEDEKNRRIRSSRLGTNFQKENVEEIFEENKKIADLEPVATPKKSRKKSLFDDVMSDFENTSFEDLAEERKQKEDSQRAENERIRAEEDRRKELERKELEAKREAEIERERAKKRKRQKELQRQKEIQRERLEQEQKEEFLKRMQFVNNRVDPKSGEHEFYFIRQNDGIHVLTEQETNWYEEELQRQKEEKQNTQKHSDVVVTQQDDYDLEL